MLPYPTAEDDDFDKLESTLSQVAFTIGTASLTDWFLERKFDNFSSFFYTFLYKIRTRIKAYPTRRSYFEH